MIAGGFKEIDNFNVKDGFRSFFIQNQISSKSKKNYIAQPFHGCLDEEESLEIPFENEITFKDHFKNLKVITLGEFIKSHNCDLKNYYELVLPKLPENYSPWKSKTFNFDEEQNLSYEFKYQDYVLPINSAKQALSGFLPFQDEPDRNNRYIDYLNICLIEQNQIKYSKLNELVENFGIIELIEYFKFAIFYKKKSCPISNKFISSNVFLDNNSQLKPGLSSISKSSNISTIPKNNSNELIDSKFDTDKNKLSKRSIKNWTPASLLSKRFGLDPIIVHSPASSKELPDFRTKKYDTSSDNLNDGTNLIPKEVENEFKVPKSAAEDLLNSIFGQLNKEL